MLAKKSDNTKQRHDKWPFFMSLNTWKAIYLHFIHSILSFVCSCISFAGLTKLLQFPVY